MEFVALVRQDHGFLVKWNRLVLFVTRLLLKGFEKVVTGPDL